jgi:hypothetical protein
MFVILQDALETDELIAFIDLICSFASDGVTIIASVFSVLPIAATSTAAEVVRNNAIKIILRFIYIRSLIYGVIMLSYKDYKKLNESLYGAFNLGLKSANVVGGIVSASSINGTEAALEAQAEEAIEEAKKMKKKMDSDEEPEEDEVEEEKDEEGDKKDSEDKNNDDEEDEEGDEDEEDDEESDDEESDEEESDEDEKGDDPKFMKKKAKKEWSEVVSDLEAILEDISDEGALSEIKKGLETIKEGMKKGCGSKMMSKKCGKYMSEAKKHHKSDCDCPVCEKKKDHDEEDKGEETEGLTAGQKKLPKALQDAILAKKGKKKGDKEKKCGKNMNEDEATWWNSVNSMLGANPDQRGWDGWTEVGEVQQAIRENQSDLRGGGYSKMNLLTGGDGKKHTVSPGDTWDSICKEYYGDSTYNTALFDFNKKFHPELKSFGPLKPGMTVMVPDQEHFDYRLENQQAVRGGDQIDEGVLQDIGNSKFVRNAVTAAGLGAAALGGYAARGTQGSGMNASDNRAVAMAKQDKLGEGEKETINYFSSLDPQQKQEFIKKQYGGKIPDYLLKSWQNQVRSHDNDKIGSGEQETINYYKSLSPSQRHEFVRTQYAGVMPKSLSNIK